MSFININARHVLKQEVHNPRSSIPKHILGSNCPTSKDAFTVISQHTQRHVQLRIAEAVAIVKLKPIVSIQKDIIFSLTKL